VDLPIAPLLPEIVATLRDGNRLVLEAPPGAGKTTAVPPAVLPHVAGEILVLEPRRLAARLAARRVAAELGEKVGERVGYQVRFEDVGSPRTRLRYVTEQILLRRLLDDPGLSRVGAVFLDEFHERHLAGDLALALLARLQRARRPDLRLAVMSATLDAAPIVAFLDGAPGLASEGRGFPVDIEHLAHPDARPLEEQVASAVRRLLPAAGDLLVFLPGAAEIARAHAACAPLASRVDLVTLHGDLPPAEQDRAVTPGPRPKVILSTNVAESSVTIPGVVAVVDSGLARVATHDPWSGLPTLRVARISRASAAQRAGRAGRTQPGRCLRLYTRHDHDSRPAHDLPEVRRADLAETALLLHALGERDLAAFPWFDAPDRAALDAAESLLHRLGAVDRGAPTPLGLRLLRFPLHPRLGRILVEAERRGAGGAGALACAILGERDRASHHRRASGPSDVLAAMDEARDFAVERARKQLARLVQPGDGGDEALQIAILAGFPDRVARRRRPGEPEILLASGGSAELAPSSVVRDAELMVAVDVEERRTGASRRAVARMASAIEPEWLLDLFPAALREERLVEWNPQLERVEVVARLRYDALVLDESRGPPAAADADQAAAVLARAALARGAASLAPGLDRVLARVRFLASAMPELGITPPDDETLRAALVDLCRGATSLADLRGADLLAAVRVPRLAELAPEKVTLAGGRQVTVRYEDGRPPWIESRLQDFFGMTRAPAVAGGRVPLVVHLLAPNGRAVQVTSDLAGFWTRHYPSVRRELMRRYPKHRWPELPV
jgi:ATP-dependent helicase HrpB